MVDVFRIITEAYELYRENWRSVVTAFGVVFVITLAFGIINLFAQLPGNFICGEDSPFETQNALLILIFCISPVILQMILGIVDRLLGVLIAMAVITPMDEMATGKPISNWMGHFSRQIVNAVLVILARLVVTLVSFAPLIAAILLNLSALIALRQSQNFGLLLGGGLIIILLACAVSIAAFIILDFLLLFLEMEMVLGGGSVLNAAARSAKLVYANRGDVVVYSLLWFVIGIGVAIATFIIACTICLLPLAWLIPAFVVQPIQLLSGIILWRRLKDSG
ncbi:MAG: hypothetical protein Sv326_1166 [Candidatus Fermentimicrarchaeum limneticum]|uniref:DUF7847 domain-containing protein n=1 Tax=Fermentimicrarchaeum limneticum TaxID=2795018 RepID=A0A7D6BTE6_FERL1|nr:MAG: hypothetical protein Sv326_1166 [Candidatus Fermentimicrarchaeum limneticum]